jgi:CheY-like chemotaxis protein
MFVRFWMSAVNEGIIRLTTVNLSPPMKQFNKVLLIEDEEIDAFLSKNILQHMDVAREVIVCKDGGQALQAIDSITKESDSTQQSLDLILLDIRMPGMDGFEFLQELRASYQQQYTVVILSSSENVEDVTKAAQFEAGYYLVKPLTEDKLKKMIARCFAPLSTSIDQIDHI